MVEIKNTVIELSNIDKGTRTVYIYIPEIPEVLVKLHHKLRIKSIIYGCCIVVYDKEMDFSYALSKGRIITINNINKYYGNNS